MTTLSAFSHRIRMWFRALFARRGADRDLAREMKAHIEMERQHLIRQGIAPDEADRRARVAFGGVQNFTEAVRDERGTRWLDNFAQDVRFALRQFARAPFATATIVGMLAIGIGVNSALLAIIDAMTLRPPSAIAPDRALVRVRGIAFSTDRSQWIRPLSYAEFSEYRAHTELFAGIAAWTTQQNVVIEPPAGGIATAGSVQFVTNGFFSTLGVRPVLGRGLPAENDLRASSFAVVVSHRYWRAQLGGSGSVLGKTIIVGGIPATLVGVAPPGFEGAESSHILPTSAWLPYAARPASELADPLSGSLSAVARLQRGASARRAAPVVDAIGVRASEQTSRKTHTSADVVPLRASNATLSVEKDTPVFIAALGAISTLILAIICSAVSALIVGRSVTRRREIGVRLSLGATRGRIVRQLLTESALLSLGGGAVGLLLLLALAKTGTHFFPSNDFSFGWRTVALTAAFALGTSIIFGLSPALHATRTSVGQAMKDAAASIHHTRLQRRLVVMQIALSQPLLVGLGVLFAMLAQYEVGRSHTDVARRTMLMDFSGGMSARRDESARLIARTEELKRAIASMPGVEMVSNGVGWNQQDEFSVVESDRVPSVTTADAVGVRLVPVAQEYFSLLEIGIVAGRAIDQTDIAGAPLAVVVGNDWARTLWGNANPVGRHFAGSVGFDRVTYTVVGVVDAAQAGSSERGGRMAVYTASAQNTSFMQPRVFVRTAAPAAALIPAIGARVRQAFPDMTIFGIKTLEQEEAEDRRNNLIAGGAAAGGGLLAVLLAAVGLYAVVALAVNQRTREIGVRVALGARPRQVVAHFFRDGVKLSLVGCAIGLPASVFAMRAFMAEISYSGPSPWSVGISIAALVTAIAMFATWLPARRAASVDPLTALRSE